MDPNPSDNATPGISPRRQRQHAEIVRLLDTQRLRRAADLAHEHLAEFPDDRDVQRSVLAALEASADPHLQRRAGEFIAP